MKVIISKTCYSRVLWILCAGEPFQDAISTLKITSGPHFKHEGVAGFIETDVEIEVKDILKFAQLWESWLSLSSTRRLHLYGLAKGVGDCK